MKVKISLPQKKGYPSVSCEFKDQLTAEYALSVFLGRMPIATYNRLLDAHNNKQNS